VLIEKEWVSFGHQFARRHGHGSTRDKMDNQISPIFLQWLDCVFQIMYQFPHEFEFEPKLLVDIADHLFSCRFGTFLFDNESDRRRFRIRERTVSIWTEILNQREIYINSDFDPSREHLMSLRVEPGALMLWLHLFVRWDPVLMHRTDIDVSKLVRNWFRNVSGES